MLDMIQEVLFHDLDQLVPVFQLSFSVSFAGTARAVASKRLCWKLCKLKHLPELILVEETNYIKAAVDFHFQSVSDHELMMHVEIFNGFQNLLLSMSLVPAILKADALWFASIMLMTSNAIIVLSGIPTIRLPLITQIFFITHGTELQLSFQLQLLLYFVDCISL